MKLKLNASDTIQAVMAVVTALGIIIAIDSNRSQMKSFNDQLRLNFFADYTRRYEELMLSLPEEVNEPEFDFARLQPEARTQTLKALRAYFNLCSEEFHLAKAGHIDAEVWKLWSAGISSNLTKKAFHDGWMRVHQDTYFDPAFRRWMDEQAGRPAPPTGQAH